MIRYCDPEFHDVIKLDNFVKFNKRKNFDWNYNFYLHCCSVFILFKDISKH